MDDKTAAIPSLKDFKDNKKTESSKKSKSTTKKTKADGATRKFLSQDTMRIDDIKSAKKTSDKKNTQSKSTAKASGKTPSGTRRQSVQKNGKSATSRSDYDSSRRVERSSQQQRRENMQAPPRKPQPPKRPSSSYYDDIEPANKKAPSNTQQKAQAPKTERKPYVSKKATPKKPVAKKPLRRPVTKLPKEETDNTDTIADKKRKKNILVTVLIVLSVVAVATVLSLTVFFKAQEFSIKCDGVYTKEEIIKASGITSSDNIFTVSKKDAQERIETECPYVESADVYSVFPNGIGIDIKLAEPAYKFEGIGGVYLLSDKGKVLEISNSGEEFKVPMIVGVSITGKPEGEFVELGSEILTDSFAEMFTAFRELGYKNITEVNITKKGDIFEIRFVYDDRIIVYVGIPEEITYKLKAADVIIKRLDSEDGTAISGELDVSTCHESGKSYFNEFSIIPPDEAAPETTAPEEEIPTEVYEY